MSGNGQNAKSGFGLRQAARRRAALPVLAVLTAALLAGCAKRDHVIVGSVPDDYRTNHPIVIAEKEQVLDLSVAASDRGITRPQRIAVEGLMAEYDRSASPVVTVLAPVGGANEVGASHLARDLPGYLHRFGVPAERIVVSSYDAGSPDVSGPVRVSFKAMRAQTNKCGRWPEDLLAGGAENKHYANFGCSYQNNLAAQIANPNDLLAPRKPSPIDAGRRGVIIDDYQRAINGAPQEVEY
ncbi:MAG TPA: CpaD family pilus assembly lipoprotein [Rhizobiaceae bacterium]|nr:CpaD family pilus assembly lipoprotein [Rhizobiaceae bacterium]